MNDDIAYQALVKAISDVDITSGEGNWWSVNKEPTIGSKGAKKRKKRVSLAVTSKARLYSQYKTAKGNKRIAGSIAQLADTFNVDRHLPARYAAKVDRNETIEMKPSSGRPSVMTEEKKSLLDDYLRTNMYQASFRELGAFLDVSPSTVQRFMKSHQYRKVGKYVRPLLSERHMKAREDWALQHLYCDFTAHIDVDEKWLYSVSKHGHLKMHPGIVAPRMPVQSKRFISKLMFITAIGRPDPKHNFDGKIGCWCFIEKSQASRKSSNREKVPKL